MPAPTMCFYADPTPNNTHHFIRAIDAGVSGFRVIEASTFVSDDYMEAQGEAAKLNINAGLTEPQVRQMTNYALSGSVDSAKVSELGNIYRVFPNRGQARTVADLLAESNHSYQFICLGKEGAYHVRAVRKGEATISEWVFYVTPERNDDQL